MTTEERCFLLSKEIGKIAAAADCTNLEVMQAMAINLALMVVAEEEVTVDFEDVMVDFRSIARAAYKAAMSTPELLDEIRGKKKPKAKPVLTVVQ